MESRERFEEANKVSPETVAGCKDPSSLLMCGLDSFVWITSQWGPSLAVALEPLAVCVLLLSVPLLVPQRSAPVDGISWAPCPHWRISSWVLSVTGQQETGGGVSFPAHPLLWCRFSERVSPSTAQGPCFSLGCWPGLWGDRSGGGLAEASVWVSQCPLRGCLSPHLDLLRKKSLS